MTFLSRKDQFGRILCGGWCHVVFEWLCILAIAPIMVVALILWSPSRRNGDMTYRW